MGGPGSHSRPCTHCSQYSVGCYKKVSPGRRSAGRVQPSHVLLSKPTTDALAQIRTGVAHHGHRHSSSIAPLPAAAHGFSAGWAVPEGRGPTGAERWIPSTRNGRCRGRRRKKFTESAVASSRHGWTNFIRPLDTGRAVCYFRPASGIDRSASWCRFPRRGARSRGRSSSVRR